MSDAHLLHRRFDQMQADLAEMKDAIQRIEAVLHPCAMYLTDTKGSECRAPSAREVGNHWFCEAHAKMVTSKAH
jgi:hypothetical protein